MKLKLLLPILFLLSVQCTHYDNNQGAENTELDTFNPNTPSVIAKKPKCTKQVNEGDSTRSPPPSVKIGISKPMGKNTDNAKPSITSEYDCD